MCHSKLKIHIQIIVLTEAILLSPHHASISPVLYVPLFFALITWVDYYSLTKLELDLFIEYDTAASVQRCTLSVKRGIKIVDDDDDGRIFLI